MLYPTLALLLAIALIALARWLDGRRVKWVRPAPFPREPECIEYERFE